MMIEGRDYFIRPVAFPNRANPACVVQNGDGTFDIYINTLYPPESQREALRHELRHIEREHFYSESSVTALEAEASGEARRSPMRPPRGCIACFRSEDALADWISEALSGSGRA